MKGAANQLNILKKELKLYKVFLASDATEDGKKDYIVLWELCILCYTCTMSLLIKILGL